MAPALGSQYAFRLGAGSPHSRSESRTAAARPNVLGIHARQNLFGFGKQKAAEGETTESESPNNKKSSRPFFLDYVPDAKSLVPVVGSSSAFFAGAGRRKDPNTVFVAGATGQSGARITQMLLRQGFAVRAGVPELASAQELARMAATYKLISPAESKRLNAVVSSFSDPEAIAKAIGPAAKAVVAIGPSENGPDAAVTTDEALRLVMAAQLSGVYHVAIVYNSTPSSSSSTNNVLGGISSFFSNLFPNSRNKQLSLSDFLDKVVETDVSSYTLFKAALTEDYSAESEHAVVVAEEGSATLGENKVSKTQIAKLVADVFSNTSVTENKVVQVSTSPSATPKPISELFSAIPEDGRRKAYAEAIAKAKAEEEALVASEEAREAAEAAKKLEDGMKKKKKVSEKKVEAASLEKETRTKVDVAGFTLDNLLSKAKDFGDGGVGTDFSWEKLSSQLATAVSPKADGKPKTQVATTRGQVKAKNLPPQKIVVKQTAPKSRPKQPEPKQPETKTEVRSVFGGLFKQETIYVDDD